MREDRLKTAKRDIVSYFNKTGRHIFTRSEIEQELKQMRAYWHIASETTVDEFITFLVSNCPFKIHQFAFPTRMETRYTWGEASDFEIVQTLRRNSYFTHFTAMHLNQLTLHLPQTLYLNYEQLPKPKQQAALIQSRIDFAFSRPCRASSSITEFNGKRVCLLNGQNTEQAGVIDLSYSTGRSLRVTGVERTLIDIAVRPIYSGGVFAVLEAYQRAANRVSVNRLAAMLTSMEHTYPFHQAIGFYLERSKSYTESQLGLLEQFERKYNFYLTHQIKEKEYSERWRIFYPKGL